MSIEYVPSALVITGPPTVLPSAAFLAVTVAPFTSDANIEPLIVVEVGVSLPVFALLHAASVPIEQARKV
jgi:hypothetical protein